LSLPYHYKLDSVGHAVWPLGGRGVRPRPIVSVTLIGPGGSRARDAVLDTAGDDTVFPQALASLLGIDLINAPSGVGAGVGSYRLAVRYAQVTLRLTDGKERREWPAWVGFTAAPLPYPLLGFAGCLQFFSAVFHGDREEVELAVNRLYPGT
jgi:hypothetical protein